MIEYCNYIGGQWKIGVDEKNAQYVMISREEYNGLRNALRIIHDRSLQQLDKSEVDEYGYKTLRAELRTYPKRSGGDDNRHWYMTKSTPYSIKMPVSAVSTVVVNDLKSHYHYYDWKEVLNMAGSPFFSVKDIDDIELYVIRKSYENERYEWIYKNLVEPRGWVVDDKLVLSFDMCRLSANYSTGLYEISYWSTVPI